MSDDGTQDRIDALAEVLSRATGSARIVPLMELGQLHSERYQHDLQHGGTDALGDLDATITACTEAHERMHAGDPYRPSIAYILGHHLASRYLTRTDAATDRDTAIDLFDEVLRSADRPPAEIEMSRFYAAQLLVLRALPGAPRMVDGVRTTLAAVAQAVPALSPAARADLDRASAYLRAIIESEPVQPEIHAAAPAILQTISTLSGMATGGGLSVLFDVVRDVATPGPAGTPGADEIRRMQESLLDRRAAMEPAASRPASIGNALRSIGAVALVSLTGGGVTVVTDDGRTATVSSAGLRARLDEPLEQMCERAWTEFFGPLDAHLRAGGRTGTLRVILVPEGDLARVPWHAAGNGRLQACAGYAVTYAASEAQFLAVAGRRRAAVYEQPVLVGDPGPELIALRDAFYPNAPVVRQPAPGATMLHVTGAVPHDLGRPRPGACVVSTSNRAVPDSALLASGVADIIDRGSFGARRPPAAMSFMIHYFLIDRGCPPPEALRRAQLWMLDPGRECPDEMPADIAGTADAGVAYWAGLHHRGR